MTFSIKHLRTNAYNHNHEEVPVGTPYGFWRVVEHTGAGWFPLPAHYTEKGQADRALAQYERESA